MAGQTGVSRWGVLGGMWRDDEMFFFLPPAGMVQLGFGGVGVLLFCLLCGFADYCVVDESIAI